MNSTFSLADTSPETPLRIEAWAEIEQHFQEQDRLIAAWLAPSESRRLNVAYIANLRETRFAFWQRLEYRVSTEPRTPSDRQRAARQYLTGYVRPSVRRASLMERVAPDWWGWAIIGFCALWYFVPALFPGLVHFLKGLFQ